jgi:hypothetical protein
VSYTSAEQTDAAMARTALREALRAADGPLGDATAALDPGERARLSAALRRSETYAEAPPLPEPKTCQAPLRGMDRCGKPGAMMRCMEKFLGRDRCSDAP